MKVFILLYRIYNPFNENLVPSIFDFFGFVLIKVLLQVWRK